MVKISLCGVETLYVDTSYRGIEGECDFPVDGIETKAV
jgi:hypothetical protein